MFAFKVSRKKIIPVLKISLIYLFLAPVVVLLIYRVIPVRTSSYIFQQYISNIFNGSFSFVHHKWVGWDGIPNNMKMAVIASEDQIFADHFGFDIESIQKALNEKRRKTRGASTITQQVARNLFLWGGRSYVRKGLEAYFTLLIEVLWSKERILEVYLNIAEFGNNIYGVGAASRIHFKKQCLKMNTDECATLAAVLPNPKKYKASSISPYLRRRVSWIKSQIYQLGGKSYLDRL
ncbi:MAG: monofunctional biosynthetic peptidoglycan transglycosylase [Bacteroidetes bacterium]|nr:monofunctional biosynthetic peptidoglycan transglycosylase [Bacteroidota bacterium]